VERFPIKLNSALIITLHWVIGFVLAPLGKYVTPVAYLAMPAYIYLLAVVLFGSGTKGGRSKVLQKG